MRKTRVLNSVAYSLSLSLWPALKPQSMNSQKGMAGSPTGRTKHHLGSPKSVPNWKATYILMGLKVIHRGSFNDH